MGFFNKPFGKQNVYVIHSIVLISINLTLKVLEIWHIVI